MPTALIISASFRVAHISHLIASYYQMHDLGYNSVLFIHPDAIPFIPKNVKFITTLSEINAVEIAIFWFPAVSNLALMLKLKLKFHAKIVYVFHEPIEKFETYKNLGFTTKEIFSIYMKYTFTLSFLYLSNIILLPSKKALRLYKDSFGWRINKKVHYVPLLFNDETTIRQPEREFFSYIGTIAQDHAFKQFVDFILTLSREDNIPVGLKFLIATKNNVEHTPEVDILISKGLLTIIEGTPLTDEEINLCYAKSFIVWNAYDRTTQSGVLAKASMFGTPAIVKKENLSEFSIDGYNVKAVVSNTDSVELKHAIQEVIDNFETYSKNSRAIFESTFNYKAHNHLMRNILNTI